MKIFLFSVILFISSITYSQKNEIGTSMGIDFISSPSLVDYINQNFAFGETLPDFSSAVNFSGKYGRMITENLQLAAQVDYQIFSYDNSTPIGTYKLTNTSLMPSILVFYVIAGTGYNFKFGGGIGPRFISLEESLPGSVQPVNYSATGFGLLLRGEGNTLIGENVYALIGADLRYDAVGEPKLSNGGINQNRKIEAITLNTLSFGVRLGLTYTF